MTSVYARLRLKKRTSINSISDFHKEKEMVDFRKCLMAFAAAALLFGLGSSAYAQNFSCTAFANPHIVRSEGVAELVGDVVLDCVGGTPTPAGTAIGPLSGTGTNVQLNLQGTYVTSRLTGLPGSLDSEAVLSIDEPFPGTAPQAPFPPTATPQTGAATTQLGCIANGTDACLNVTSLGPGFGASGTYNGTDGHPNIFQGQTALAPGSQINWFGVPIDAPGTTVTRIIRITNVRANICSLTGGTTTLVPIGVTASIALSGSQPITINNPVVTVAYAEQGLTSSVNAPFGPPTYQQCNNLNYPLLLSMGADTVDAAYVLLSATEAANNPNAFKAVSQLYGALSNTPEQDVLGYTYFTESGWIPYNVSGLDQNGRVIGLADTPTEVTFTITGVPNGVNLYVPNGVDLSGVDTVGFADLVTAGGILDYNPSTFAAGNTQLTVSGGTASATYAIYQPNPNTIESLSIPLWAAWQTTSATNPTTGSASVAINFAPGSTAIGVAAAPIPRFCQNYKAVTAFTISPCTCNLLFPFVTNQAGFDTGVAIANTTNDPYGTTGQTGTITLNYYGYTGPSGPAPAAYTTQAPLPPGTELTFTLSSGGGVLGGSAPSILVPATGGFQGYIIAQANFQYCHGFAFISDAGAQKLAEGYLALSLDVPEVLLVPNGLNRTGQAGENEGH
jgi:hypothetical protein